MFFDQSDDSAQTFNGRPIRQFRATQYVAGKLTRPIIQHVFVKVGSVFEVPVETGLGHANDFGKPFDPYRGNTTSFEFSKCGR